MAGNAQHSAGGSSSTSTSRGARDISDRHGGGGGRSAGGGGGGGGGARQCRLCACAVPGGEEGWRVHTAGIRHRRADASMRLHGVPDRPVVSIFEALPPPQPQPQPRRQQQEPRRRQQHHHQPRDLQRLQQRLRAELAAAVGVGAMYARAAERFAAQRLDEALAAGLPGAGGGGGQLLRVRVHRPEQLAVLQLLLPPSAPELDLTVPYQTYGPSAAAMAAAAAVFAASLAHNGALQRLAVRFSSSDGDDDGEGGGAGGGYAAIAAQGGVGMQRLPLLWARLSRALGEAARTNCALACVALALFPGQVAADELCGLAQALAAARPRLRVAVLLGTHARAGAESPLRLLPRELVARVVREAVPPACQLQLDLPAELQPLLVGASSGSSGSDDTSSESSGSSSTDTSDSASSTPSDRQGDG